MAKKPPPLESKCQACNGTGFQPSIEPGRPGRKIYPPRCEVCDGKGHVKNPTVKDKSRRD